VGSLRLFATVLLLAGLAGCAPAKVQSKPGTTTTVILTRHADTDPGSGKLNPTGRERAKALAEALGGVGVTAIYSPNLERNLDTVGPLASRAGIEITRTAGVSLFAARSIVDEILDKHAGGVVVWVGNASGNLQAVYRMLGGSGMGPVEYGDLHILTIPDQGVVGVVKRRYGP
jgi:hypothetical protein